MGVTADGELILFHDDSLTRTTDAVTRFPDRAPWTFTTFTLADIRSLDAGAWFVDTDPFDQIAAGAVTPAELASYRGEQVPTLREALIWTQEVSWHVNLELKRLPPPMEPFPIVERVLALIGELGIATRCIIISSFNHDWLREVQARCPQIAIQALIGWPPTQPLDWGDWEFEVYNARSTLIDEEQIHRALEQGKVVNIFTVNEESEMRRFIAAGVAGLFTDFPQRLAGLRRVP